MIRFIAFALILFVLPLTAWSKTNPDWACEVLLQANPGITVVLDPLTPKDNPNTLPELIGVPVRLVTGEPPAAPEKIPGLVLHIGNSRKLAKYFIGDDNPMLIDERLQVEDHKWNEYVLIHAIDPAAIPLSINAADLIGRRAGRLTEMPSERSVESLVATFFDLVRAKFPEGAFIKHSLEASTADEGTLIMTFKTKPADIAAQFTQEIKRLGKRKVEAALNDQAFSKDIMDEFSSYTRLVIGLLLDPAQVFAQKKVEIERTSDGANKEIRVDFVAGRAICAHSRWSLEYNPRDMKRAMAYVNAFFNRAPPHIQRLSGGADVIFLADGSLTFMELNLGSQSAYMDARDLMVPGNLLISGLKGSPTPLIERLERAHRGDFAAKAKLLSGFTARDTNGQFNQSPDDLQFLEALIYLRNRAIDDLPHPARAAARRRVMEEMAALAATQSGRIHDRGILLELNKFLAATRKSLEL